MGRTIFRVLASAAVLALAPAAPFSAAAEPAPAGVQSACAAVGGTVDSDQTCHFTTTTSDYKLDFRFPTDYPDQQALTGAVTQERDSFVDWVADTKMKTFRQELDIIGRGYQSGSADSGTRSLVLTIGSSAGVHPTTSYRTLNYDMAKHAPITFDTLFKPGSQPLDVLNPIVQREIDKHGGPGALSLSDLGMDAYRNFAITDDAVIFFFDQDGLLDHTAGDLRVSVPRADIAAILA